MVRRHTGERSTNQSFNQSLKSSVNRLMDQERSNQLSQALLSCFIDCQQDHHSLDLPLLVRSSLFLSLSLNHLIQNVHYIVVDRLKKSVNQEEEKKMCLNLPIIYTTLHCDAR